MKPRAISKRLLALAVSAVLLGLLIWSVDGSRLVRELADLNVFWFSVGVAFFVPQLLAISRRWVLIAGAVAPLDWKEAGRQVVASSCLNLVLPSKLGDLAKGVFLYRQGRCRLEEGLQIVVFEKALDMAALSAWMLAGWLVSWRSGPADWWVIAMMVLGVAILAVVMTVYFVPRGESILERFVPPRLAGGRVAKTIEAGPRIMGVIHADGGRKRAIVAWSGGIWLLHLLQIACFFWAMGADVGLLDVLALMPMAIFAGLLPIAVAGIGIRDWAVVAIFSVLGVPAPILVGTGLLISLRYVVPALAGIAFVPQYFSLAKEADA